MSSFEPDPPPSPRSGWLPEQAGSQRLCVFLVPERPTAFQTLTVEKKAMSTTGGDHIAFQTTFATSRSHFACKGQQRSTGTGSETAGLAVATDFAHAVTATIKAFMASTTASSDFFALQHLQSFGPSP